MKGPRSVILYPVLPNLVPRAWCQALNFYKRFSVLHIIGLKSTDKVSRPQRRACGRDPPFLFFVSRETCACDLWPRLADCGACLWAGPTLIFYFCLRAGGILPALLFAAAKYLVSIHTSLVFIDPGSEQGSKGSASKFFLVFTITNIFNF